MWAEGETCEETLAIAEWGRTKVGKRVETLLSPPGGILTSFKVQIACHLCQVALTDLCYLLPGSRVPGGLDCAGPGM